MDDNLSCAIETHALVPRHVYNRFMLMQVVTVVQLLAGKMVCAGRRVYDMVLLLEAKYWLYEALHVGNLSPTAKRSNCASRGYF